MGLNYTLNHCLEVAQGEYIARMDGDDECVLSIPEGDVLAGEIPGRQLRNAQTFIDLRNEELMLNWKLCMDGKDVVWIDPIR